MDKKTLYNWGMFLSIVFGFTALIVGIVNVSKLQDAYDVANKLSNSNQGVSFSIIFTQILFPTFISIALTVVFWGLKDTDYTFDSAKNHFNSLDRRLYDIEVDIKKIKNNSAKDLPKDESNNNLNETGKTPIKDETDVKLNEILELLSKIQNPTSKEKE